MTEKLFQTIDRADPNSLPDALRAVGLGSVLMSQSPQTVYDAVPALSPSQIATLGCVALPNEAKAASILRAYCATGAGTKGEQTIDAYGTTPADGEVAVAPNGDIVCLTPANNTLLTCTYVPMRGDVVQLVDQPVVTNALLLPTAYANKVLLLLSVDATTGTTFGMPIAAAMSEIAPSVRFACCPKTDAGAMTGAPLT